MKKIATITPINCITHEQDGDAFTVFWDETSLELSAIFADDHTEFLEYTAKTLDEAADTVYSLYAPSNAYIYEAEEIDE